MSATDSDSLPEGGGRLSGGADPPPTPAQPTRTVLDELTRGEGLSHRTARFAAFRLRLDPGMPFDQFQRWVRLGREYDRIGAIGFVTDTPTPESDQR